MQRLNNTEHVVPVEALVALLSLCTRVQSGNTVAASLRSLAQLLQRNLVPDAAWPLPLTPAEHSVHDEAHLEAAIKRSRGRRVIDVIVEAASNGCRIRHDTVLTASVALIKTAIDRAKDALCEGNPLRKALRTCFHVAVAAQQEAAREDAKRTLRELAMRVFLRAEQSARALASVSDGDGAADDSDGAIDDADGEDGDCFERARARLGATEARGRYGWCVVCRRTARHYCRQSGLPVCSSECKQRQLESPVPPAAARAARRVVQHVLRQRVRSQSADCRALISSVCQLAGKDGESETGRKRRLLALHLLHVATRHASLDALLNDELRLQLREALLSNLTPVPMHNTAVDLTVGK
ncbi:MAG: hypothetical protein MHM6MM_007572, partial [Cercozoa sp. M6MM]